MGIGGPALGILSIVHGHGQFEGKTSVCELGNQELNRHHASFSMDFPFPNRPPDIRILEEDERAVFSSIEAKDLYQRVGISDYNSIDINGLDEAHVFDLNLDIREAYGYDRQFDVVTNFGTTEHVCDQMMAYKNIHNLCKVDGLMIGVVPFSCALDHGFFNAQPNFFEELAKANDYELLGLFYTIAHMDLYTCCPYPYSRELLEKLYADIGFRLPSYYCEEQIGYIFKKTKDAECQLPYQSTQVYHNQIGLDLAKGYKKNQLSYLDADYTMDEHISRYSPSRQSRYYKFSKGNTRQKLTMIANKFRHPRQVWTFIKRGRYRFL
jgi:hypothetical protein